MKFRAIVFGLILLSYSVSLGQQSVARLWNEVLLESIRHDLARPTVHARNLFHISSAMYDAWTLLSKEGKPYLIGNNNLFPHSFDEFLAADTDQQSNLNKAISYASYRLLIHRFKNSPGRQHTLEISSNLMAQLGFDADFTSTNYTSGSAAALGNYIASVYISYGMQDGANEANGYSNVFYEPINDFLDPTSSQAPTLVDPNRWQPLAFNIFIDQSGNEIPGAVPEFLSPEWGQVSSFSLKEEDKTTFSRNEFDYQVYQNPGSPPFLETDGSGSSDYYKWGFSMVAIWSSHLDASNPIEVDISPSSIGNISFEKIPKSYEEYNQFYDFLNGGDLGKGRSINPITNLPYESQIVRLGDYGRVLAEFWADGPDSETPPGHWFTLLNYVSDHPLLEKRFTGSGEVLSSLEWDIKSYFILGGAMHDAAIAAWGIKGYYDYIRPISAIRYMASQGQSSDSNMPNYSTQGILLIENKIELILENDPLAGENNENLNKIKLKAWKGPEYIENPDIDEAGVDWILAENWWPYQRPTFVTPPFAGYISGHSTYSRAAAEVLTLLTGDAYFPGGIGEFLAKKNEFLVFEEGPSEDIILQWATYRDASDQCSLSRIWGGIHPPADDIPGRIIGERIGKEAFNKGSSHFKSIISATKSDDNDPIIHPNPATDIIHIGSSSQKLQTLLILDMNGKEMISTTFKKNCRLDVSMLKNGLYLVQIASRVQRLIILH